MTFFKVHPKFCFRFPPNFSVNQFFIKLILTCLLKFRLFEFLVASNIFLVKFFPLFSFSINALQCFILSLTFLHFKVFNEKLLDHRKGVFKDSKAFLLKEANGKILQKVRFIISLYICLRLGIQMSKALVYPDLNLIL